MRYYENKLHEGEYKEHTANGKGIHYYDIIIILVGRPF